MVAAILDASLPPINTQSDAAFQAEVQRLTGSSLIQLQANAKAELTPEMQARVQELMTKNNASGLSEPEQTEIETFYARTEAIATTRAAALWLLRERHQAQ